ncbi:hypothetical protein VTL71DRAFT_5801 [Oculimacula yallundae]|uniref:F-box domain-containing protein n=1 Tax=Oculimacula yallundae TaxID=86028 RepID=A0ABR4BYI7_9HELO
MDSMQVKSPKTNISKVFEHSEVSSAQEQNGAETNTLTELKWLPYDIFCHIASQSSLCSMTCFGLTNKAFYKYLKAMHPDSISLSSRSEQTKRSTKTRYSRHEDEFGAVPKLVLGSTDGPRKLGALLRGWIGPKYQLWSFYGRSVFLNIETYGTVTGERSEKVQELRQEYWELRKWNVILSDDPASLWDSTDELDKRTFLVWKSLHGNWSFEPKEEAAWKEYVELSHLPVESWHLQLSEEDKADGRWVLLGEGLQMLGL